jgi:gliding motility-associated-like protein
LSLKILYLALIEKKMRKTLFILLSLLSTGSFAAHLVGGELSYRCIGGDNYEVRLIIYRDCSSNGAPFDNPAIITVYDGNNVLQGNYFFPLSSQSQLPIIAANSCSVLPSFVCTEEGIYIDTINLPINLSGYTLSHQRCCRNSSIINIPNPGTWGSTYTIQIPPQSESASCNSSAQFSNPPPLALCLGSPVILDMTAIEVDGDSLAYKLCTPLHGGGGATTQTGPNSPRPDTATAPPYQNVPFSGGYSSVNPIAANPNFSINAQSGLLTGLPSQVGQYVFAICVEEWRNGNLLSILRRDFQFNVSSSCTQTVALIEGQNSDPLELCLGKTVQFTENCYNTQSYLWDFGVPGISSDVSNLANPSFTFPDTGIYIIRLIANPGSPCADTTYSTYLVYDPLNLNFTVSGQQCFDNHNFDFAVSGNLSDSATFIWDFGGASNLGLNSQTPEPKNLIYTVPGSYIVSLTVQDGDCAAVKLDTLHLYPRPILKHYIPLVYSCAPQSVRFIDSSDYSGQALHYWDFGDGGFSNLASPTYTYTSSGIFAVYHQLITLEGCRDTLEEVFDQLIEIKPTPINNLSISPPETTIYDPFFEVELDNIGATESWLILPTGSRIDDPIPFTYEAKDTGIQTFIYISTNEFSCNDTSVFKTYVEQPFRLYIPNAFSPNSDGTNDVFAYSASGANKLILSIFNRWGEEVFHSNTIGEFWNGQIMNSGEIAPGGVYVYRITIVSRADGTPLSRTGQVSLIR